MIHLVPDPIRCIEEPSTYTPIFSPHDTNYSFGVMPTCDWFSNDALYSLYPNISTTVLTFPLNRIYAAVGFDQPNIGRCMFYNLLMSTPLGFEQSAHTVNFTSQDLFQSNKGILNHKLMTHVQVDLEEREREEREEIEDGISYSAQERRRLGGQRKLLRKISNRVSNKVNGGKIIMKNNDIEDIDDIDDIDIDTLVNSTFTVFIARNCSYIIENFFAGNSESIVCKSANTTMFAETDPLMFVERKYLERETMTGPSQFEILPSRIFSIDL
jgi:hypothetical protein